uniref:Uncharacterized protein n=1 Tax=Avena sativa TaxID=4498 RepID=A0ACD5XAF8_AVESA
MARSETAKDTTATELFHSLANITVGDGKRVYFWRDMWINGRKIEDIAPGICQLVSTQRKISRLVAEAIPQNAWVTDIAGGLDTEGYAQCVRIWVELSSFRRDPQAPDTFSWIGSQSGQYTAKDIYKLLFHGDI